MVRMAHVLIAFAILPFVSPAAIAAPISISSASPNELLYCSYGRMGHWRRPGDSIIVGIAVVEVHANGNRSERVGQPSLVLIGNTGEHVSMTRLITVERLFPPQQPSNNDAGYYLYSTNATSWDNMLSPQVIRLRVRVLLPESAYALGAAQCRISIGPYVLRGPVNSIWPNG